MKIIIILFLILFTIERIHTIVDPTIAMCIDGEVNTAFLTLDGSTYIFMESWFWKLKSDLLKVEGNASEITMHWPELKPPIQTSFYISGDMTGLNGSTIFVKDKMWWSYINQKFQKSGSTSNWTGIPEGDLLAITQQNDPILVFFKKHNPNAGLKAFYFDNYYFPDSKDVVKRSLPFDQYSAKAIISYPNGKYLVFFDDNRIGGHCIMPNAQSGCLNNRLNSDLFDCPDFTKNLFSKNIFIKIWFWSGLGLKQFGILTFGVLLSISFILIFLVFLLSLRVRKQCLKKCKK